MASTVFEGTRVLKQKLGYQRLKSFYIMTDNIYEMVKIVNMALKGL